MLDSKPLLEKTDFPKLTRTNVSTLQVNLGYLCNLSCVHCHVNAGPTRTELMSKQTIDEVLKLANELAVETIDLTGGAPEMNPHFCYLVEQASKQGFDIIDRCNLTILQEASYHHLAEFLAQHKVKIIASLPCYIEDNVDKQRGNGVFQDSIKTLVELNQLGYGIEGSDLELDLVFNPQGASLPPEQTMLENSYKAYLKEYGVVFNHLYTLTNMPIKRFGSILMSKGTFDQYMALLVDSYNEAALDGVMCHSTLSIDWQGYAYDCDFNQMLGLNLADSESMVHIRDITRTNLQGKPIATRQHCYGCTAGQGSSCGGALTSTK